MFDEAHEVDLSRDDEDESAADSNLMASTDLQHEEDGGRSAHVADLERTEDPESKEDNLGKSTEITGSLGGADEEESDSEDDEEEGGHGDDEDGKSSKVNLYNPADYKDLDVSSNIQKVFDHIERYTPGNIDLDTRMKPFIPEYIPSVGDIDSFLKVPHPEGKKDGLGLTLLDEPASQQSDPAVLDMRLRLASKQTNLKPITVRCIESADKEPKKITRWIENIQKVHREKPPPTVIYSNQMPDIEQLMQVWPPEFEDLLKTVPLPSADIDLTTEQYARVVCSILDVPIYENVVESLHVLFTLYAEFKKNQHFQH
eukprot:jgi/Bigna1/91104/estExt_fgenesh1_pg.C_880077